MGSNGPTVHGRPSRDRRRPHGASERQPRRMRL